MTFVLLVFLIKITISTGEGGMVCSNNKFLIRKVIKFKGQGLNITNKKNITGIMLLVTITE